MDAFFAAVHVRDDPSLVGQPVVVGGDPSGRGVVAAANYEVRQYGVHSAMPAAQARRLCPHAVFLKPEFRRYKAEAERIFAIYHEFTPIVEPMSLDEAYLDVSDHLEPHGSATAIAKEIRRRVREERHLTVSVGVASNKLLAKIASDFDKPDGLTVVRPSDAAEFLAPLPVRRLHGIGPATERTLESLGVRTVAELRNVSLDQLLARFGHWGRSLWNAARGEDERTVHTEHTRKSLSTERTFPADVDDLGAMDQILAEMAEEVSGNLDRRGLAACTVFVKVRYPDFTTLTRSHTFDTPVLAPSEITECAQQLLRRTEAASRAVRLLGVGTSALVSKDLVQLPLFDDT
jgi:DNA polymerase-4